MQIQLEKLGAVVLDDGTRITTFMDAGARHRCWSESNGDGVRCQVYSHHQSIWNLVAEFDARSDSLADVQDALDQALSANAVVA